MKEVERKEDVKRRNGKNMKSVRRGDLTIQMTKGFTKKTRPREDMTPAEICFKCVQPSNIPDIVLQETVNILVS